MTAREAAILDQVRAAGADLLTRRMVTRLPALNPRHRATAVLGNRLLVALDAGLELCEHLQTRGPQIAIWQPSAPALQCSECATEHSDRTRTTICDLCDQPDDLEPAGLQLGAVLVMPCLCTRCRRPDRRSDVDHLAVRRQVTRHVVRLYAETGS